MRAAANFLIIIFVFLFSISTVKAASEKESLVRQAISDNLIESQAAISDLRKMKQSGLDALFETYAAEIERFSKTGEATENWKRITKAIDGVAQQKDAYASRLFWLTDFEEAKKVAKETNKPILSLRLLGNLDEEFSCANSRFFRAVLYSNEAISKYLRENYVLHWKSVRPAPKVTIDFGDGRKIERTLTGNSIHYVLDENGSVINALPGLYRPRQFHNFLVNSHFWLNQARDFESGKLMTINNEKIIEKRRAYLRNMRSREYGDLRGQMNRKAFPLGIKFDKTKKAKREFEEMPTAIQVAPLAITKMSTEVFILKDITPDITKYGAEQIDLESWKKLAGLGSLENSLDEKSVNFIRIQTAKNTLSEQEFAKLIKNLESLIALDSVRNDFLLRPTLLVWLNKDFDKNVEQLNERVYAELFLTPNEDKWLGLYAPDLYTALDGNGIIK